MHCLLLQCSTAWYYLSPPSPPHKKHCSTVMYLRYSTGSVSTIKMKIKENKLLPPVEPRKPHWWVVTGALVKMLCYGLEALWRRVYIMWESIIRWHRWTVCSATLDLWWVGGKRWEELREEKRVVSLQPALNWL
jgi:hypothetical protein